MLLKDSDADDAAAAAAAKTLTLNKNPTSQFFSPKGKKKLRGRIFFMLRTVL